MSIKVKIAWDNNNAISEGVRIYRSDMIFTPSNLPDVLFTVTGFNEYDDTNVEKGQTYFYMLSCILGEQEVFTECFEILVKKNEDSLLFAEALATATEKYIHTSAFISRCAFNLDGSHAFATGGTISSGEIATFSVTQNYVLKTTDLKISTFKDVSKGSSIQNFQFFGDGADLLVTHLSPFSITRYRLHTPFDLSTFTEIATWTSFDSKLAGVFYISMDGMWLYHCSRNDLVVNTYQLKNFCDLSGFLSKKSNQWSSYGSIPTGVNELNGFVVSSDGLSLWLIGQRFNVPNSIDYGTISVVNFSEPFTLKPSMKTSYNSILISQPFGLSNLFKSFGNTKTFCGLCYQGLTSNFRFKFFDFS